MADTLPPLGRERLNALAADPRYQALVRENPDEAQALVQALQSSGRFGPVEGETSPMPSTLGTVLRAAGRGAGQPGTALLGKGTPDEGWGRWSAREALNTAPYVVAGAGATAALPANAGRLAGLLARGTANAGAGAVANPEDPGMGALTGGGLSVATEAGLPMVARGVKTGAQKLGFLRTPAQVAQQAALDEAPAVAQKIGQLFEKDPALSSSGVHPNLPALTAHRASAAPIETMQDLYDFAVGGRGKDMVDDIAGAVRDDVGKQIGRFKLMVRNPQTKHVEALSFDEAWSKRSLAAQKAAGDPSALKHTWGLSRDEWDKEISQSLTRINKNGVAAQAYQTGLDLMSKAYGMRDMVANGFTKKGGRVLDTNALRGALNDMGEFSSMGTAPPSAGNVPGRIDMPLYHEMQGILGHTPGAPVPGTPEAGAEAARTPIRQFFKNGFRVFAPSLAAGTQPGQTGVGIPAINATAGLYDMLARHLGHRPTENVVGGELGNIR